MSLKLADSVLHRFVQILQEALLTGTDVSDHLRMVRVEADKDDPHVLVLTDEYKTQVAEIHKKYEAEVEEIKARRAASQIVTEN